MHVPLSSHPKRSFVLMKLSPSTSLSKRPSLPLIFNTNLIINTNTFFTIFSLQFEMGNTIGRRKRTKVMKINGEIVKLKTPVRACDVVKDYPDHVLLDIKAAKQFGVRAKPLHSQYQLEAGKIYLLIELPKLPILEEEKVKATRNAKEQLECLKLSRRSVSDLSIGDQVGPSAGPVRVKMRLLRAQVDKLIEGSRDETEVTQKILDLYLQQSARKTVQQDT